ncbi:hypothetical protein U1Q18_045873 [Sarracenia purpurea var. burkii]
MWPVKKFPPFILRRYHPNTSCRIHCRRHISPDSRTRSIATRKQGLRPPQQLISVNSPSPTRRPSHAIHPASQLTVRRLRCTPPIAAHCWSISALTLYCLTLAAPKILSLDRIGG